MQIYNFAAEKSNLILMSKQIRLKKGLNIHLFGAADRVYASVKPTNKYVVKPTDFHSLMPKLSVKVGDKVKAGTPLFFDKKNEKYWFNSTPKTDKLIIDLTKIIFTDNWINFISNKIHNYSIDKENLNKRLILYYTILLDQINRHWNRDRAWHLKTSGGPKARFYAG